MNAVIRSIFAMVSLIAAIGLLVACGRQISEVRMVSAPLRAENCPLEFLTLTINQISPMAPEYAYELIGHVMVGDTGSQDPVQPRNRDIVRPRACNMGGEAVAVMMQAGTSGGSGIDYAVVRKRQAPGAAPPPSKF